MMNKYYLGLITDTHLYKIIIHLPHVFDPLIYCIAFLYRPGHWQVASVTIRYTFP